MSVSEAVPLTQRRGLVQVNQADPSTLLKWSGTVEAAVGGGTLIGTCTVPTDLACLWIGISAFLVSDYSGDAYFAIREDLVTVFHEVARNAAIVDGVAVMPCYEPPPVIWTADVLDCRIVADNVDADDLDVLVFAFGWDKQVARNIPQRFMWPALPI